MTRSPRFLAACLCGLGLSFSAIAAEYGMVRAEKSSIRFVARQMGSPVEGHFSRFIARVSFDPAKLDQARAQIDVDIASIEAGSAEANEEVKSRDWFNIKEIPAASFVATRLKSLGGTRYEAVGKMSIKGQTREIVVPLTAKPEGADMTLEGTLPVRRLQYGIGGGIWSDTAVVADEVQVHFRLVLGLTPPSKTSPSTSLLKQKAS